MKFNTAIKIAKIIDSIIAPLSALLLLLSFIMTFDAENGYFTGGAFPIAFTVTLTLGLCLSLLTVFCFDKKKKLVSDDEIKSNTLPYAIIGIAAVLFASLSIFLESSALNETVSLLLGAGIGAIGLYSLLLAQTKSYKYSHLKLGCLIVSALFPVGLHLGTTTDYTRPINSVENVLTSTCCVFILLYILYEAKRLTSGVHSRMHLFSILATFLTTLSLSTSYILAYLFGSLNEEYRFNQMFFLLLIAILSGVRLTRFISGVEELCDEEIAEREALKEIAQEEINENSEPSDTDEAVEETVDENNNPSDCDGTNEINEEINN